MHIQEHNMMADQTYEVAHNKFSDWSEAEYKNILKL